MKLPGIKQHLHPLLRSELHIERKYLISTLVFMVLAASLEGLGIGLLVPFLESLTRPENNSFRTGLAWIDHYILDVDGPPLSRLYRTSALLMGAVWLRGAFEFLANASHATLTQNILHRLRSKIIDQIQHVALSFFSLVPGGKILNTITTEMERLRNLFGVAAYLMSLSLLFMVYTLAIIWLSPALFGLALFFSLVLLVSINQIVKMIRNNSPQITEANGRVASIANEIIQGIRTIKAFCAEEIEKIKFVTASLELRKHTLYNNYRVSSIQPLSQALASTGLVVMVIVAVKWLVLPGYLSTSTLLITLFALFRLLPLIKQMNHARSDWAHYRGSLDNVAEMLDPEHKPFIRSGNLQFEGVHEEIRFDNVSFAYEPGVWILKNIKLHIPRGKTTAIVGASGSGKSTLVDLIPRFYEPQRGRILIDGVDIRLFDLKSLRSHIGIVSQDTFLFNDTIRANIAYGMPNATDEEIFEAARKANALEFILEMPEGFHTVLGDRGVKLSGGQRQRIAIARAILRDPDILILDEATSALDSRSEKLVQESLQLLMKNRTVLVIAHRLATVAEADKIVVLEQGRIVEEGSYEELLNMRSYFWQYYNLQFQTV